MKIIKKMFIVFISLILIFNIIQSKVYATGVYSSIKKIANSSSTGGAVTSVNNMAGSIISIAKVICAGVAIIMITVIAMKYMLAAPSEKADIKKHAVVYVVGAIIMFAATAILQIIQSFAITAIRINS